MLVVDDDPKQRAQSQEWLESAGYAVSLCGGLEEFEAGIDGRVPDLVLFDVLMPGFGVDDLERLLRHFPATSGSPIVLHSPLPAATLRRLVRTSGALGIIETTSSREDFLTAFRAFAESLLLRHRLRAASSGTHRIHGTSNAEESHGRRGSSG